MTESPEPPAPGVPFYTKVCKCIRCGRLVTAETSVERGAGAKCWEHLHGRDVYARLEAQGQLTMFPEEARA
jgi:hypothetical protein